MLTDTHCHLDDPALSARLPDLLAAARTAGIGTWVVPGVAPEGWETIVRLAAENTGVHAACGLHPMHADRFDETLINRLSPFAARGVAIGEIGLDYLVADISRETQQAAFRAQLRLGLELRLPVLIHCRRAFRDLLAILREEHAERIGGVMHAFSGSPEVATECIRLGFLISVAGSVTYRNAVRPVEIVRQVPLDCLVLETDAPDMPPEPHRGMANEPAFLIETARKVAGIKGITVEEVARVTTANAKRLFRI